MKTLHFIAGFPRAGSTLLCNILNQNPRFHATSTSGILEIVLAIRNQWENVTAFAASPNKEGKTQVMRGILNSYHEEVERPVVFDKSRGWVGKIDLAEHLLGARVKILVPVRSIVDILASFEKLYRANAHDWEFPQEKTNYHAWQTMEGRANVLMQDNQPVGLAYNQIRDSLDRGFEGRMHLVEFEDLTCDPKETMAEIYKFLDEDLFEHDFNNVEQVTHENDDIHGIPGLHTIRPKVEPVVVNAAWLIGNNAFNQYYDAEFWRHKDDN